jgi:hypothetical protein
MFLNSNARFGRINQRFLKTRRASGARPHTLDRRQKIAARASSRRFAVRRAPEDFIDARPP